MPDDTSNEPDPESSVGLQTYRMLHEQLAEDNRRMSRWRRLRNVHWLVKLVTSVVMFGLVTWFVGDHLVDRVVENQRPLLSGATQQVKESFRQNFDKGTCDLKRELITQAQDLQDLATKQIDHFQRDVYRRLGISATTTTTTLPLPTTTRERGPTTTVPSTTTTTAPC